MVDQQIFSIRNKHDIINVRMHVREAARNIGMDLGSQARISLATSSLTEKLGLGIEPDSNSIAIKCLNEGHNKGLRVVCTFCDSKEAKPVNMAVGNVSWLVDTVAIRNLSGDQVEITLTKWVMRRPS